MSNGYTTLTTNNTGWSLNDYIPSAAHSVEVNINGGIMQFGTGVRHTSDGYLGYATVGSVEVYEYPQVFDSADEAYEAISKHITGAFARFLA